MSSLSLVSAVLPTRAKGSMITESQLPSKKANRSCSPNKAKPAAREHSYTRQLGFTVASDLAGPRACISPPSPASLGQTNNHHQHSQGRAVRLGELVPPALCRGEPHPIGFALSPPMTPRMTCSSCRKKKLPACHSEFGPKWAAPPKQMGKHLKNVLCLWGHVVFPIII